MNVVDSSAWLEYFANGPNAEFFAQPIENVEELVVPAIVLYEVFKRLSQQRGEEIAVNRIAALHQGIIADLDAPIAIEAARLSLTLQLPMADSIILATARRFAAALWTQDAHFEGLADVRFRAKVK